jgi:predicted nucleic acid-binding protein
VDADLAAKLLHETILPRVHVVELGIAEVMTALEQARRHGVRGGGVYDFMHLVAARKVGADILYTVNFSDFRHLTREGDPEVRSP